VASNTIVRPRHRGPKRLLSREAVVAAALDALRDGGPDALTMRALAARLDTGPASLYAWVRNQRALHVLVLDAIAAQVQNLRRSGSGSVTDSASPLVSIVFGLADTSCGD